MTAVELPEDLVSAMRGFAEEAYPEECCGFLLSPPQPGGTSTRRRVVAIEPAPNVSDGERRRRFVISPAELRAAEERAGRAGREVSGFYHSHPDHPARPSEFDQDHAWPWYSYLVLSVRGDGEPGDLGAFELDPERREFHDVTLAVLPREGGEPGTRL
ncbi:MAG TPA: M67 family metallopeptidase [Thermoplasmata archaeon]|nr:M67 family metallopeptidase [Thermoplasmata archaeon]